MAKTIKGFPSWTKVGKKRSNKPRYFTERKGGGWVPTTPAQAKKLGKKLYVERKGGGYQVAPKSAMKGLKKDGAKKGGKSGSGNKGG